MPAVSVVVEDPGRAASLAATLDAAARAASGHTSLGDAIWRSLARADRTAITVVARVADHGDGTGRAPAGEPVGLCHAVHAGDLADPHWALGAVLAPGAPPGTLELLAATAADRVGSRGGGRMILWLLGATDALDREARAAGFEHERDLYEMRVALPTAESPRWPAGVRVRTFDPARDVDAWLALNNEAFAGHPEQGGWTAATLEQRMAEPWFDPEIFLVAEDPDGLVGFNWLKVHAAQPPEPPRGEIHVIGVAARGRGSGIGRALALEGLARLHAQGITTGMLYVAAENAPAVGLYRALGFHVHRVDRAYGRTAARAGSPAAPTGAVQRVPEASA